MKNRTLRLAVLSMLTAAAIILGYVESLVPFNFAVPGIKAGLANTVTLLMLNTFGIVETLAVLLIRILVCGALFGSGSTLLYSLAGGLAAFSITVITGKLLRLKPVICGMAGGVTHNLTQLLLALLILKTKQLTAWLPILAASGIISGIITGTLAELLNKPFGALLKRTFDRKGRE